MTLTLALPSKGRLQASRRSSCSAAPGSPSACPATSANTAPASTAAPTSRWRSCRPPRSPASSAQGSVDLGITGEDLLRETLADWEARAEIAARLGFGHADVVVAVPDVWLDVDTMADLDDVAADFRQRHGRRLRIATKYWRLTQQFFSQKHGIQVYRIVESLGATEGAPAAGLGRRHRRHHHHRLDAARQPSEGAGRRRRSCGRRPAWWRRARRAARRTRR